MILDALGRQYAGIDAGPVHGGAAFVTRCEDTFLCAPEDVAGWSDADGAKAAQKWLSARTSDEFVSLAWHIERPFVLSNRPGAGAAQYRSLVDWSWSAGSCGAQLVEVDVSEWRRSFIVPNGPGAAKASRAWVEFLFPTIPLGTHDHLSDAVLLALRHAGGAAWAMGRLAAGGRRAQALMLACAKSSGRRRRKVESDDVLLPDWVREHQAKHGRGV